MTGLAAMLQPVQDLLHTADASATIAAVRTVVKNPTANTTLSALVLSVAAVFALLVIVLVMLLLTPSKKKVVKIRRYRVAPGGTPPAGAQPRPAAPSQPPKRDLLALPVWAIVGLVVVAVVGGYISTGTHYYCAGTCHAGTEAAKSASKAHKASCAACHEVGGPLGVFANASSRSRMGLAFMRSVLPSQTSVPIDSHACLRCHRKITSGVTKGTVRMSHGEVVDAGYPCVECHEKAGHTRARFTASMSSCLPCHDSRTASSGCSTCHTDDPGSANFLTSQTREKLGSGRFVYPAVRAANRNCGGCHNQERDCDGCHGIRMPHTFGFIEGGHAIAAAFERKLSCWKCHDPQTCSGKCHTGAFDPKTGNTSHAAGWKQEHKQSSWDAGCVCHSNRGGRKEPICTRCHASDHSLLPVKQ